MDLDNYKQKKEFNDEINDLDDLAMWIANDVANHGM